MMLSGFGEKPPQEIVDIALQTASYNGIPINFKIQIKTRVNAAYIFHKTAAVDLASETARAEFFKSFAGENGIVSELYFVAGVDTQKAFIKYDERRIINQARVNYEAALSFTNYALKNKGKNLNILAVSSLTGVTPMPYFAILS